MRLHFFTFIVIFTVGCTETPEVPSSKEVLAKEKIKFNKTEAQQAQDDYIKLQRQRSSE